MYPKHLITIAGFCTIFLTSCTGIHLLGKRTTAPSSAVAVTTTTLPDNKNAVFVGPPEYIPETPAPKPSPIEKSVAKAVVNKPAPPKIIEKGGQYVYISPSYTRAKPEVGTEKYSSEVLQQKIRKIKKYAMENNFDTTVAFFVDMEVKSGKERFLVVNLKTNEIIKKGLVAHGKGNEQFTFNRQFSNDGGSNCTSLGIYKIGKSYNGAFGLSYKLFGLNKTNYNALRRYVVLHSMGSIPEKESPWPITQSEGCPAVAPSFLQQLTPILDNAKKNVLLYIYNGDAKES